MPLEPPGGVTRGSWPVIRAAKCEVTPKQGLWHRGIGAATEGTLAAKEELLCAAQQASRAGCGVGEMTRGVYPHPLGIFCMCGKERS